MPRWPAGLHPASGSLWSSGGYPRRPQATGQGDYWRSAVADLHAGAAVAWPPTPGGPGAIQFSPSAAMSASAGPAGVGERWLVDLVRVVTGAQVGLPPLVVQQVAAQITGTTTTPPPPVVAQVWLAVAGQNIHLLAQTTQGGNDDLAVGCPPLSAGEAIAVVWYGLAPGVPAWFSLRGTKTVLSAE